MSSVPEDLNNYQVSPTIVTAEWPAISRQSPQYYPIGSEVCSEIPYCAESLPAVSLLSNMPFEDHLRYNWWLKELCVSQHVNQNHTVSSPLSPLWPAISKPFPEYTTTDQKTFNLQSSVSQDTRTMSIQNLFPSVTAELPTIWRPSIEYNCIHLQSSALETSTVAMQSLPPVSPPELPAIWRPSPKYNSINQRTLSKSECSIY